MNTKHFTSRRLLSALAVAAASAGLSAGQAGAVTILDGSGGGTSGDVAANFGSNAAGTPNIALTWSDSNGAADLQWDHYNNWDGEPGELVFQVNGPTGTLENLIEFAPDAGWNVVLTSLDVHVWNGGGDTDINWRVFNSSGDLASGTWSTPNDQDITYNIGVTGTGGETLTLGLSQTSGRGSYLAIDNLTFDQVAVPEPGSMALLLGGVAAIGMRRKKKS